MRHPSRLAGATGAYTPYARPCSAAAARATPAQARPPGRRRLRAARERHAARAAVPCPSALRATPPRLSGGPATVPRSIGRYRRQCSPARGHPGRTWTTAQRPQPARPGSPAGGAGACSRRIRRGRDPSVRPRPGPACGLGSTPAACCPSYGCRWARAGRTEVG